MNDLDKIIGAKHIFLSEVQQRLLNIYTNFRIEMKLLKAPKIEYRDNILKYLNQFYQSLEDHQKSVATNWLTYEICNIDPNLITSARISEFAITHNIANLLELSSDNDSFIFRTDSILAAEKIKNLFDQEYPDSVCKILEYK